MARTTRVRMIGFGVFAVAGLALLLGLGIWQVQRLAWKQDILARIDARIAGPAEPLPRNVSEAADEYQPVTLTGQPRDAAIRVLVTTAELGPAYRLIYPLDLPDGRAVLLDAGAVPATPGSDIPDLGDTLTVTGNLLWPDEVDGFTPDPDLDDNIWFARDLPTMAATLNTDFVLVVANARVHPDILPLPITSEGIPNDHLQYAITWFSLAAIWAGMTLLLLRRMARSTN
ncbi:surfeit locus 1 family protein [Palleronia salina]|uniref:SURF1-like protein n=1 Tax=Palleronia salina TaxID=313368 RepID=A0A1M6H065_9RHOB|nr:SURF1 family protein [Palleronia salina]SHJ15561.1 surfeit locus 1 family protein [Palleronia salina]